MKQSIPSVLRFLNPKS
ncbi:uncharacterized protein M6B38_372315 [Iris pallida]|uniref:Uncharacterized protein n=1 Tax=Iris pallida TaxID=29817 RepID=A0AAX6GBW8_IRIPA|nr:uncharacterized protein M6B38_372315 [Iris pallida]